MINKLIYKAAIVALLTLSFPLIASAGVNPNNGDFYITYSDIRQPSGEHSLDLERTYNSLSTGLGWFGYGWGTLYESRLVILPDNTVAVKERGNGRTTYYHSKLKDTGNHGVERIVEAAIQRDKLTSIAADALAIQLRDREDFRLSKVLQYEITTTLPKDAVLGDSCGGASLILLSNGYKRIDCNRFGDSDSAVDTFDLQGRLVRHELADGYAITIRYPDVKNAEICDSRGRSIALTWTPEGRVATAKAAETALTYTYNTVQNLIKSENAVGLSYRYIYDDAHNLTQIMYVDDTKMTIDYFRKTGMVTSVTERNREPVFYGSNIELGAPEPVKPPKGEAHDAGDKAYEADDFTTAIKEWQSIADKNPATQFKLAMMYSRGKGVTQDPVEALKRVRKSADAGYSTAQALLGMMYENGDEGVAKDLAEATKWYRKAADQHNAEAQFHLGIAYFRGEGVTTNRYEAVELIGKAANQGLVNAQLLLGEMYSEGIGVRKAADQGDVNAQRYLE